MRIPAFVVCSALLLTSVALAASEQIPPLPGYVVHFDFFENEQEGKDLIHFAKSAGAKVINLVPPAHVWERPDVLSVLDNLVQYIADSDLKLVITRIDASYLPDRHGRRENYLYKNILNRPGVLSDGRATNSWFLSTVGVQSYDQWMEDETRFYAKRYSYLLNLIGFNLGPFSEPFVSQRGGFLQYDATTGFYELTQYTAEAKALCGTSSPTRQQLARTINDWFVGRYEACRKIWKTESDRKDVPFILQFSGFDEEKFKLGYPEYAAFNRMDWVSRADAIGLSIYLNGGYADLGRSSIEAMVRHLQTDYNFRKRVFVLEGGVENPTPVFDKENISYFATIALPLKPVTYIYEFLKDPFYADNEPNSGRLLKSDGTPRADLVRFLKKKMKDVRKRATPT